MRFLCYALIIAAISWPTNAFSEKIEEYFEGRWAIAAATIKDTNVFAGCTATGTRDDGYTLISTINRKGTWYLSFISKRWNYNHRKNLPVRYRIDGGKWRNTNAEVLDPDFIRLRMPGSKSAISRFQRGMNFHLFDGKQNFTISLRGTHRMTIVLARCVLKYLDQEKSGTPISRKIYTSKITPDRRSEHTKDTAVEDTQELRAESTRILFNFLSDIGLQGAKIVSRSEFPKEFESVGAVARAENFTGVVHTFSDKTMNKSKAVISELTSGFARNCIAKFAADTSAENISGVDVYSSYAICRTKDMMKVKQYLVAPRHSGGTYVVILSTVHDFDPLAPTEEKNAEPEISREDFRRAAFLSSRSTAERIKLLDDRASHLAR